MIRKYHNHKPQTAPLHREEEPLHHHETPGRQIKQSNQQTSFFSFITPISSGYAAMRFNAKLR